MDLAIILTYRCDSRCSMCHIWKNPTHPDHEVDLPTLERLPGGFDYLNVTGGEPTLREDLEELCDVLYPKTKKLEINSNGLHIEKLLRIIKKHPDVKIRLSVEGFEATNDAIRGEQGGYQKKMTAIRELIEAGGCDLGFATTFQDENIGDVVGLFREAHSLGLEFATSALHNGFQFHKNDNVMYDRVRVAHSIEGLVTEMLRTWSIKNWFRAYLNLGLMAKVLGHDRLIPCTAGSDFIFIDPWADVYACNVRPDLLMGNLKTESWESILDSPIAREVRTKVHQCTQNCWMVASAKTAMRNKHYAKLPKISVLNWVILNKLRVMSGAPIPFNRYVDFSDVYVDSSVTPRESYLARQEKRSLQPAQSRRYSQFTEFFNR
jgi:Fe-coproporphyrin III synthase